MVFGMHSILCTCLEGKVRYYSTQLTDLRQYEKKSEEVWISAAFVEQQRSDLKYIRESLPGKIEVTYRGVFMGRRLQSIVTVRALPREVFVDVRLPTRSNSILCIENVKNVRASQMSK